jgi:nicotinamide-nucleotide amidase
MRDNLTVSRWRTFTLLALLNWGAACGATVAAQEDPKPSDGAATLDYVIVVTGGELLEGVFADAHTAFITRTLLPMGCRCVSSIIVDDRREEMLRALGYAVELAPLVIVTGGLGPTANDVTRETIAAFRNVELREDPEVLAMLERRFGQSRELLRPNLRRQAMVPVGGRHLPNAYGTAVGLVYPGAPSIVALPGPPRELQGTVDGALMDYLREQFGVRPPGASIRLRFVGAGQSQISQTIEEHLLLGTDVMVGSTFEGSRVDFTFSLAGRAEEDRRRLDELAMGVRRHLGEYLYAEDGSSLEDVVVSALLARGASLVIAEVGSGGLLAASLHAGERSDELLTAAFAAPTEVKMRRLLGMGDETSESFLSDTDRMKHTATRVRERGDATWGLAAGPETTAGGAASLRIVLVTPGDRWASVRLPVPARNIEARSRFATQVLDWLRRELARGD